MSKDLPGPFACGVPECDKPVHSKKMCQAHYRKFRKYGTATPTPSMKRRPGPAPDPSKWRSRHNPDNPKRLRPKVERAPKTHCKRGHELTDANVYVSRSGSRSCKTCLRENTQRWRSLQERIEGPGCGSHNRSKTHCPQGHEYSETNTYTYSGKRHCRECQRIRSRELVCAKYGLTVLDYEQMLAAQGHSCAICRKHMNDSPRSLHIDHDHLTGQVRGLLCFPCNKALGEFKDSPEIILKAAEYVLRSWD